MLRRLKTKAFMAGRNTPMCIPGNGKDKAVLLRMDHETLNTERLCDDCYKLRTRGPLLVSQVPSKSSDSYITLEKGRDPKHS